MKKIPKEKLLGSLAKDATPEALAEYRKSLEFRMEDGFIRNDNEQVKTVAVKRNKELDKVIPDPLDNPYLKSVLKEIGHVYPKKKPMDILTYIDKVKFNYSKQPILKNDPNDYNFQSTKKPDLADHEVLEKYYAEGTTQERAQYLKHKRNSKELDKRLDKEMGIIKETKVPKKTIPQLSERALQSIGRIDAWYTKPQHVKFDVREEIKRTAESKRKEELKAFDKRFGKGGIASLGRDKI